VDDEAPLRRLARATFGTSYRLLEAADGTEALALARSELPDLILLDVKMPGLDGVAVCHHLKNDPATSHIRVLMLSGMISQADQERSVAAGADGYLTKPFSPSALLASVERALSDGVHGEIPLAVVSTQPVNLENEPIEHAQTLTYARELSSLYQAARNRAARFRRLVEIGREMVGATSLDALLRLALDRATNFGGYGGGSILLAQEDYRTLVLLASLGVSADRFTYEGGGPARRAAEQTFATRRPLVVESLTEVGALEWPGTGDKPTMSVYLPLITPGGRPIGVLELTGSPDPDHLGDHDLDALQLLAAQLAATVESSQLSARLRRSLEALIAIHEAGQVLGSSLELNEVAQQVLSIAKRVSGFERGTIRLRRGREPLRLEGLELEGIWRTAQNSAAVRSARRSALRTETPRFFMHQEPSEIMAIAGWCLPLRSRDRIIGVIEVYSREVVIRETPVEVLISLANQAASALDNAYLYRELTERERRLHELVGRLLVAQEEERRRVAYEVHDGLAQVAVATHQHLQAFAHRQKPRSPQARQALEFALVSAQRTVAEARLVIAGLRPTVLDDFGLETAIRTQVDALRAEGWEITYNQSIGAERLVPEVETALFRVTQEALTNVRKHADTTRVEVDLRRRGHLLRLEVRDWGRGFQVSNPPTAGGPGEHVGLPGMRERVALLGGRFSILSQPGAGTRIIVEVGLRESS
ncbi:MAG TPA: GAF domain-containing protein, partial [Chloroflexota bacterium]|nr:GAF domain-containing protein [Chloroflexota bacterium]